jgi:adenylate cyclase
MPADLEQARGLFKRATERDPMFAAAYVGLARVYFRAGVQYLTLPTDEAARLASAQARKAIELDAGDADALASLAEASWMQGDLDNAREIAQQALAINLNCASAHLAMGRVLIFTGHMAEGRQALGIAQRLSPRDPNIRVMHHQIVTSYYWDRDFAHCVEAAGRQLMADPDFPVTYRLLAAALGQLGRTEEARAALDKAISISPRSFDVYVRTRVPWMRSEDYELMLEGLRKAGWRS